MKTFSVQPSKLKPGKIDVLMHNNESHSSVWTLTPVEYIVLVKRLDNDMVGAVTQALSIGERKSGH